MAHDILASTADTNVLAFDTEDILVLVGFIDKFLLPRDNDDGNRLFNGEVEDQLGNNPVCRVP